MPQTLAFETIYSSTDATFIEIIDAVLKNEGFNSHAVGLKNTALPGVGDALPNIRLQVPINEVDDAKTLIKQVLRTPKNSQINPNDFETHLNTENEHLFFEEFSIDRPNSAASNEYQPPQKIETGYVESKARNTNTNAKQGMIAVGIALVLPGMSQVYAHKPWSGGLLMLNLVLLLICGLYFSSMHIVGVLGVAFLTTIIIDAALGYKSINSQTLKTPVYKKSAQIFSGLAQITFIHCVAWAAMHFF